MPRFPIFIAAALLLCAFAVNAAAERYSIDSAASDIHWRIYSGGALPLGHNHVISASNIRGHITLAGNAQPSSFELVIPVAGLVVDSPTLRRRYGSDFSSQPSAKAIAGTRNNMLGSSLLNAAAFPEIRIRGSTAIPEARSASAQIAVGLRLAGRTVRLTLPAQITRDGRSLRARGDFTLTHRQLGLKPFRAAMGALQVAERIDFHYDIRARRRN